MTTGLIFATLGTFLQALTYCLVKETRARQKLSPLQILLCAHLLMGLFCLIPFVAFDLKQYVNTDFLIAAAAVNISYLFAQFFLFSAISQSDPSAASPYLILKLPLLALLTLSIFDETLSLQQLAALALIVILSLLYTGAVKIRLKIFILVSLSALCFALCDVCVIKAVRFLQISGSPILQSVFTIFICDVLFLVLLPVIFLYKGNIKISQILGTTPLAVSWILGVTCVVVGFNLSGVISGNIILSLRPVFAIILVALLFRSQLSGEGFFKLKGGIAACLCLCVAGYYL